MTKHGDDRDGRRFISPEVIRLGQRTLGRVFKTSVDQEVADEIEHHVQLRAREFEAAGMSPEDARREAEARFGDLPQVVSDLEGIGKRRDEAMARQEWWGESVRDVRYALRQLKRSPGFGASARLRMD